MHHWALYDGNGKPIQSFRFFNDAVNALSLQVGEWGANWSSAQFIKGLFSVMDYEGEPISQES